MTKTSKTLREARALIADKSRWGQQMFWDDAIGLVRYCAVGALRHAVNQCDCPAQHSHEDILPYSTTLTCLHRAARDIYEIDPVTVNDDIGHNAVLDIYDRAIKYAEMEEANDCI